LAAAITPTAFAVSWMVLVADAWLAGAASGWAMAKGSGAAAGAMAAKGSGAAAGTGFKLMMARTILSM
jgi:hypothetical protein